MTESAQSPKPKPAQNITEETKTDNVAAPGELAVSLNQPFSQPANNPSQMSAVGSTNSEALGNTAAKVPLFDPAKRDQFAGKAVLENKIAPTQTIV